MKYLVAIFPDEIPPENKCEEYEPVIPAFPMGDANHFIGILTGGVAGYAVVLERDDIDPDDLLDRLVTTYPGLPRTYLEYVLVATMAVASLPQVYENVYRIFVTETTATLHNVDDESELVPIWEGLQPSAYM